MALLDSEFSFTGPLGNLSAYRMRGTDKIVIRRKGGASKKQIKTSPSFVNTRRVNAEFGGRAFASKWIMHMLYHVKPLADYNIAGPLNAILKPTQDLDTTNKYGERSVLHSQKRHLLHGFSLTRKTTFESVLRAPLTYELSREMMSAEIHLPELIHGINFHTPRSTDGEFSETYPNGQLKIKGFYKNGKADSTWTFYFSDGKIFKTGNYKDCSYDLGYIKILEQAIDYEWHERGIENGTWKIYDKNGVLKTEYKSVCGIRVGRVKVFNDKGQLKTESFYANGELHFERELFDNGVVSKYSTFSYYDIKENEKHNSRFSKAIVSVFYDTGELEELYAEDKNEFQGEYKKFWKNGFLQYEATYDQGDQDGIVREYYDNGLRESETEYKKGKKHGQSFLYSRDGKIIKKEIWDNGVLKKE